MSGWKSGNALIVALVLIVGALAMTPTDVGGDFITQVREKATSIVPKGRSTDVEVGQPPSRGEGESLLKTVTVTKGPASGWPDYDRDAFGYAWKDVDRNGCDTRIICT